MNVLDFQQAAAARIVAVFRSGQNRILLADEVGLGKTIIAREAVRQVSQWHQEELHDDHFKVVYICSNINIANQNIKKLGIDSVMNVSDSRLSMQHLRIYQNAGNGHEYEQLIPLTPGTSFSMTNGTGTQNERALMLVHLRRYPLFAPHARALKYFLADNAKVNWKSTVDAYQEAVDDCAKKCPPYNSDMQQALASAFQADATLAESLLNAIQYPRSVDVAQKRSIINRLRRLFAKISLEKLEPDLVIMDEFQRFRDLIAPSDDEQGMLSQQFLNDAKMKVLLLSATPYKPYSTLEEISLDPNTEHYAEFMEVMRFLFHDPSKLAGFKVVWQGFTHALSEISTCGTTVLLATKKAAQEALYQGMCRTERPNSGILDDSGAREMTVSQGDILSYTEMQTLLDEIKAHGDGKLHDAAVPVDYVKSSPYLLSFMDQYVLKKEIEAFFTTEARRAYLRGKKHLLVDQRIIREYLPLPANNARLSLLMDTVFENKKNGVENLLWVPASRPNYTVGGVFAKNQHFSKILVFSAWEMVPRMIAIMLSYEAERLTIGKLFHDAQTKRGRTYFASREERRFGVARLKDESRDIVCYVSPLLADLYDPTAHIGMDVKDLRKMLADKIGPKLAETMAKHQISTSGTAGARALLDVLKLMEGRETAAPVSVPENALDILVNMAIGAPAVCLYRLLRPDEASAREAADRIFVSMFNKAESAAIIDLLYSRKNDDAYYENVFQYCVDGNLQAVLEEYGHMVTLNGDRLAQEMADAFADTVSLQMDTDESFASAGREKPRIRCHFAVGYFNARLSDDSALRADKIRKAFNSPFRPFVLATTSIGQEGLDFHCYCRKVMHWNLPANPVDLEQREGRVNRYKCLAVRQNIAQRYGSEKTWEAMFAMASQTEKGTMPDLVPYWCLTQPNTTAVKIERIVPMYPFSLDRVRYQRIIKLLSLYRLTLGQPRQEELIEVLSREADQSILDELFMQLSPYYRQQEELV